MITPRIVKVQGVNTPPNVPNPSVSFFLDASEDEALEPRFGGPDPGAPRSDPASARGFDVVGSDTSTIPPTQFVNPVRTLSPFIGDSATIPQKNRKGGHPCAPFGHFWLVLVPN